ncbi:hypothetical protein MRX96_029955 [Rhipicephalus microplus]
MEAVATIVGRCRNAHGRRRSFPFSALLARTVASASLRETGQHTYTGRGSTLPSMYLRLLVGSFFGNDYRAVECIESQNTRGTDVIRGDVSIGEVIVAQVNTDRGEVTTPRAPSHNCGMTNGEIVLIVFYAIRYPCSFVM